MKQKHSKKQSGRYGLPVRIMALVLSILVTGGVLTYLAMLIMQLF